MHYRTHTSKCSAIFQEDVSRIVSDLRDEVECEDGESLEQAVWRYGKERNRFRKKGTKCRVARYLAILWELKQMVKRWGLDKFELKVVSVELDFITKKALPHIQLRSVGGWMWQVLGQNQAPAPSW